MHVYVNEIANVVILRLLSLSLSLFFKDSFPVGSSVEYCCKPGSMILEEGAGETESKTITCLSTGEWSGQPPKCSGKKRRRDLCTCTHTCTCTCMCALFRNCNT